MDPLQTRCAWRHYVLDPLQKQTKHHTCYYFRLVTVYRLQFATVYRLLPFTVGYRLPSPTVTVYRLNLVAHRLTCKTCMLLLVAVL